MNNIDIEKYNDINFLSTLLFDVLYNKKMNRKLNIEDVKLNDIKIENIKKIYKDTELRNLLNNIFNRDITYENKEFNKYIFKVNDIDHNVDIVLKIIDNSDQLYNSDNMNKIITYLLSGLVINKKTKHILMNILNVDVNTSDIKKYIDKYTDNEDVILNLTKKDKQISIEIREHFFKLDSLYNLFNDNSFEYTNNDIRVIIFQVLHTLAVIQDRYPTFKHNNLDLKNIYCYLKEKTDSYYEYTLDDIKFNIPNIGLDIKITNFDDSVIVNKLDNESIIDSLKLEDNTYDIKIFLDSLLKINKLSNEIKIFIKDIMSNLDSPKKIIFGNSSFNSYRSKSGLSEVSYDSPKMKRFNLAEMSSEIDVEEVNMGKIKKDLPRLSEVDSEVSVSLSRTKKSSKKSSKRSSKKGSKKGSKKMKGGARKKSSKKNSKRKQKRENVDIDEDDDDELVESINNHESEDETEEKPKKMQPKKHLNLDDMSSDVSIDEDEKEVPKMERIHRSEKSHQTARSHVSSRSKMSSLLGSESAGAASYSNKPKTNKFFGLLNGTEQELSMQPNLPMVAPGMKQGPPGMMQGPPGMMQGGPPMMQGGPPMMQGPPGMMQGPPMMQGGPPMMQGPPGMMQGPPGMMQGPPGMMQGPPGMMQGPALQSGGPMEINFNQNGPMMQGPPGMMQGPPGMMQGPPGMMMGGSENFFFDSQQSKNSNDQKVESLKYNSKKISQTGGLRVIPKFIEPYSNPYQPIDEGKNKSKMYFEEKKGMPTNPLNYSIPSQDPLNGNTQAYIPPPQNFQGTSLQLNIPQANPLPQKVQQTFNPTYYVPMTNPYAPNTVGNPFLWHPAVPPIVQKYNITFGGADVQRLGEVYEDMLPTKIAIAKNTFNSLSERLLVLNYLRTVLIKQGDGEEIGFDIKKRPEINALLSHLKIIGVNPYNYNKMTNNPYTGLPDRLLVYKSCYPIKVDNSNAIKCANDNIGINVRIYQLLEGEAVLNMVGEPFRKFFEVWREIAYYEYIREEIVKKNVSPNFVQLISYFTHPRSLIDFVKYRKEKDTKMDSTMEKYYKIYNEYVNNEILKVPGFKEKLIKKLEEKYAAEKSKYNFPMITNPVLTSLSLNSAVIAISKPSSAKLTTFSDFINEKLNIDAHYMNYSNTCLIALTEAPTQNIKEWSCRKYEQNGINLSILKMISTGYHDPDVWKSVLFQLQSALFILHKKGICIWNFNLENNVYIKDTNYDNNNIGYWKYKINGVEFYVPNYGSIVLIDSNFKDLDVGGTIVNAIVTSSNSGIEKMKPVEFKYKIMMSEFFDNDPSQISEINTRNNELFKTKIFNTNEFDSTTDKTYGGIPPESSILDHIKNIGSHSDGNTLNNLIVNNGHFLHNRTGTLLNESEKKNLVENNNFNSGDLIAYTEDDTNIYMQVYLKSVDVGHCEIIKVTRDANNKVRTEIKNIEISRIKMITEKIKQSYKPNFKLADEELIETYEINIK
jgi:hypothetical protein